MFAKFLSPIKEYKNIAIFRHQQPDGDAVCSQLALKAWLQENFKEKDIRAIGNDTFDVFPEVDEADDDFIRSSLAIVLDTANGERVDDQRYGLASKIIKIDHHIIVEDFGDINIVNEKAAATCEILTFLLIEGRDDMAYRISPKCASYLYGGIISDTCSFTTSNTTPWTISAAHLLSETGISINDITKKILETDLDKFECATKVRQLLKTKESLGYVEITSDKLKELGINGRQAKNAISEFNRIKELKIWLVAVENEQGGYDLSIRSKKEYPINITANKYHGGGHKNAVGVKNLSKEQLESIKNDLIEVIKIIDIAK